ncbi:MAG: diacylglycerol kinase family lipid kinase [Myxococcales bacterium]|nr:diacylglycerol kinase family lipid kinase [Myxococcales bacterium]MDH5307023.1 diacylglycerol kinase family lipid kinase [Myxococcales bacterium]
MVPRRTLLIVNPRSRGGATGRRWKSARERLRAAMGPVDVECTRGPRDAERLAREGVRAGVERIVVAGGDGTLSEVVAGLLGADLARYVEIGLLPFGTGGDFSRTLGIPRSLDAAIAHLAAGRARPIDAVCVRFRNACGEQRISHGINVASFGLSGLAATFANRTRGGKRGPLPFLRGALRAIASYRSAPVAIRVDGSLVHEGPVALCAAANGSFFGGGMKIAPDASAHDGLLDVVVVSDLSAAGLLLRMPAIYRGTHVRDCAVSVHRGRVVEAEPSARNLPLEIDGEPAGALPARFELLPGALAMIGCAE